MRGQIVNARQLYQAHIEFEKRAADYAPDVRILRPAPLVPGEIRVGFCPCCCEMCFYAIVPGVNGRDLGMTRSAASGANDGYRRSAIYGEFIFESAGVVYWHSAYEGESYETVDHALSLMLDDIQYVKNQVQRERERRS
jgi:hypothetical protein